MRHYLKLLNFMLLLLFLLTACGTVTPTTVPTPAPRPTSTPAPTNTPVAVSSSVDAVLSLLPFVSPAPNSTLPSQCQNIGSLGLQSSSQKIELYPKLQPIVGNSILNSGITQMVQNDPSFKNATTNFYSSSDPKELIISFYENWAAKTGFTVYLNQSVTLPALGEGKFLVLGKDLSGGNKDGVIFFVFGPIDANYASIYGLKPNETLVVTIQAQANAAAVTPTSAPAVAKEPAPPPTARRLNPIPQFETLLLQQLRLRDLLPGLSDLFKGAVNINFSVENKYYASTTNFDQLVNYYNTEAPKVCWRPFQNIKIPVPTQSLGQVQMSIYYTPGGLVAVLVIGPLDEKNRQELVSTNLKENELLIVVLRFDIPTSSP